ncbi:hypothetical protein WJX74_003409 [Apatococcus lobatus]|uniref:Uncharacterized protein n=1 Tax=Apatococcus lobatus TaxID=904363 RepID=A0AAW1QW65_9CHLO
MTTSKKLHVLSFRLLESLDNEPSEAQARGDSAMVVTDHEHARGQHSQHTWASRHKMKPTALTKHKSFLNRFQKGLRSVKDTAEEKARAAGQAAERLKSFAGGLRSAILRDDHTVEDQWAPASRSKHLQSLRAASVPLQPGSPSYAAEGDVDMGNWSASQPPADPKACTAVNKKDLVDTAALDAEMEAFVDDLLAVDVDMMDEIKTAADRAIPAQTSAQNPALAPSLPASNVPTMQAADNTATQNLQQEEPLPRAAFDDSQDDLPESRAAQTVPQPNSQPGRKVRHGNKPAWAMTEDRARAAEAAAEQKEEEDLLGFAASLDYDAYLDDLDDAELKTALQEAKRPDANEHPEDKAKWRKSFVKALNHLAGMQAKPGPKPAASCTAASQAGQSRIAPSDITHLTRDTAASIARREQTIMDQQQASISEPGLPKWDTSTQLGRESVDEGELKAPLETLQDLTSSGKALGVKRKTHFGQQVLQENPELRRVHSPASMGGLVSSAASTIACEA